MSSRTRIPRNRGILRFDRPQSRALKESMIFEAKSEAGFLAGKSSHTPALLASLSHEPENLKNEMGSQTPSSAKEKIETVSQVATLTSRIRLCSINDSPRQWHEKILWDRTGPQLKKYEKYAVSHVLSPRLREYDTKIVSSVHKRKIAVRYDTKGLQSSEQTTRNQLSETEFFDISGTNTTVFSTGKAPKNLHKNNKLELKNMNLVSSSKWLQDHSCYMTDAINNNSMQNSKKRKRGEENPDNLCSKRNLTPVTIMVVDTIDTIKSRNLLKVLLDSGSTTTLINKRCLPKQCKPCQISQN